MAATISGNRDHAQREAGRAGAEIEGELHNAVRGGHRGVVTDLLKSGASPEAKDTQGWTPLPCAVL